ncbi:MAG: hypothetical protein GAK29_04240 [Acinetobacter bereziniae]|uniref:Uncharacterized protein n=1 Tax=Acinetobacter bereziniae TaxID=106648 RepID=A0A833PC35_ACIBZ|nr:MAG: hypothetical protein GAK29_04240 [Acinetobacter bereziniae]
MFVKYRDKYINSANIKFMEVETIQGNIHQAKIFFIDGSNLHLKFLDKFQFDSFLLKLTNNH